MPERLKRLEPQIKAMAEKTAAIQKGHRHIGKRVGYGEGNDLVLHLPTKGYGFGNKSHSPEVLELARKIFEGKGTGHRISGAGDLHLGRLTQNNSPHVEKQFGMDLMKFYINPSKLKNERKINEVLSLESPATEAWWTLSPYLHQELLRRKLSDRESVEILLNWASLAEGPDWYLYTLPGIPSELINRIGHLEPPNWKSTHHVHKFAQEFAKIYVPTLLEVLKNKK